MSCSRGPRWAHLAAAHLDSPRRRSAEVAPDQVAPGLLLLDVDRFRLIDDSGAETPSPSVIPASRPCCATTFRSGDVTRGRVARLELRLR